jgi:hypothetical protein
MDIIRKLLTIICIVALAACGSDGGDGDDDTAVDVVDEDTVIDEGDAEDVPTEDVAEEEAPTGILACELPERTFWTWDLSDMPPSDTQVTAQCRGWADNVAVYVPDDLWLSDISADDVVTIVETFEDSTPADASRGIYDITTTTFGPAPNVDEEPRVILLYMAMGTFMGSEFDGFFRAQDEMPGTYSNETEMLHLNGIRLPVAQDYMLSIVAHEFQHMLHYRADPNEESWINETMSEAAMALCGYYTDEGNVAAFAGTPDVALVTTEHVDYGAVFLFGVYLIEQLGETFLHDLTQETANGISGFDTISSTYSVDFLTIFSDWVVANYLDDPSLDSGQYGYSTYDPPDMDDVSNAADGTLHAATVNGYAADYLRYPLTGTGTDVTIHVESADYASLGATLVTFNSSGGTPTVTPISLLATPTEVDITVPDGDDTAVLVVYGVAEGSFNYSHSALW